MAMMQIIVYGSPSYYAQKMFLVTIWATKLSQWLGKVVYRYRTMA